MISIGRKAVPHIARDLPSIPTSAMVNGLFPGRRSNGLIFALLLGNWTGISWGAVQACQSSVAQLVSAQGQVEAQVEQRVAWRPAVLNEGYCVEDRVRTGSLSRAVLAMMQGIATRFSLNQNTLVNFLSVTDRIILSVDYGDVHVRSHTPRHFDVTTPFVNAGIEGTEFLVSADAEQAEIRVFEGNVKVSNAKGSISITAGQTAYARAGQAPQLKLTLKPTDAVQWALYYPPIIDVRALSQTSRNPAIRRAVQNYQAGHLAQALSDLESAPQEEQGSSDYLGLRAGLLLSVGQVDQAEPLVRQALRQRPADPTAQSVLAVIALARNDQRHALELARQAVEHSPQSAAPWLALSYVEQARFDLRKALEAVETALKLDPDNGLVHARHAEILASLERREEAVGAAELATRLNPDLSRTHAVLGFTRLMATNTTEATRDFQHAIEADSFDPLAHFGLGLAKIREGKLEEGTEDIEIAGNLDPNDSLIRSYLGKAYYEQKRGKLAETQFELAKRYDPNDPTPHFYDAIRKQSENRPVEALHDLQSAMALNGKRAVYRSRQMLDSDQAARSAAIGRIYNDLGYGSRALVEGWGSLNQEPTNYSAHRLLADSYAALPRHQVARVSELLQSQLLQSLNVTPLQPSLGETNLPLLSYSGPERLSFHEFNPLFARNKVSGLFSGIAGSNDSYGDEATLSGIYDKFSFSLGQLHYQTNGFRSNNDQQRDIYNAFFQSALNDATSVQVELRNGHTVTGDTRLRFGIENFSPFRRETENSTSYRLGAQHIFSPQSRIIASLNYRQVGSSIHDRLNIIKRLPALTIPSFRVVTLPGGRRSIVPLIQRYPEKDVTLNTNANLDTYSEGPQFEIQHLFLSDHLKLVSGYGHIDFSIQEQSFIDVLPFQLQSGLFVNPAPVLSPSTFSFIRDNIYSYATFLLTPSLAFTTGASIDLFEYGKRIDTTQFNPKFGLLWHPLEDTTVRLAAFRETAFTQDSDAKTIEPTQVAGFNQFFDDYFGAHIWRYGIGLDQELGRDIHFGAEVSYRDVDAPMHDGVASVRSTYYRRTEFLQRTYLYWNPYDWLAGSLNYQYESNRAAQKLGFGFTEVDTHRVPIQLRLFHPSGFTLGVSATYVSQSGIFQQALIWDQSFVGNENFWVADATLDYRLPDRHGLVSVGVKNLFGTRFDYFDTDVRQPQYIPDRVVYGKLTLAF